MERSLFNIRFREVAARAQRFAQSFVLESLPEQLQFHLYLNSSYDLNASADFKLFPEDSLRRVHLNRLSAEEVVNELWRAGLVPQWADLGVVGETDDSTLLEVTACGRFTADEACLYHQQEGYPPFHATGPVLPVNHVDGVRFSIYDRTHCWTPNDLVRAQRHADRIWSLDLFGPAFDDALFAELRPSFAATEIVELRGASVTGLGLSWLASSPRLRVLRIASPDIMTLDLRGFPQLPQLEVLSIAFDGDRLLGVGEIASACPKLGDLTIHLTQDVSADDTLGLPELSKLSVTAPLLPSWLGARGPETLYLHCSRASSARVCATLAGMTERLASVGLRGTPVDDGVFAVLARMPRLKYVNLVDTSVSQDALSTFVGSRPGLKHWPRVGPG